MEDRPTAAIRAYVESQSKVLDRVFDNIERTGGPSSADLAFCLPDDVIAGLPETERYNAFVRKLRFLGYAMWKSSCYRQTREHTAFEAERTRLLEHFPKLDRRFQESMQEGHPAPVPTVALGSSPDSVRASVAENGCTLFELEVSHNADASLPSDEIQQRVP